ncbi:hypothetical protein [Neorhizobium sp. DAR64861/K0K2]|uniref:hypothetical protein n=1 Tax=unclassified Neorhizobium TaxID=2629175 RepID=UPI003D290E8F
MTIHLLVLVETDVMIPKEAKNTPIYARNPSDHTDVRIEQQIELCQDFSKTRGWRLLEPTHTRRSAGRTIMVGQYVLARQLSGNLGNQPRTRKLLSDHAEELLVEFPEWEDLQVLLVSGRNCAATCKIGYLERF